MWCLKSEQFVKRGTCACEQQPSSLVPNALLLMEKRSHAQMLRPSLCQCSGQGRSTSSKEEPTPRPQLKQLYFLNTHGHKKTARTPSPQGGTREVLPPYIIPHGIFLLPGAAPPAKFCNLLFTCRCCSCCCSCQSCCLDSAAASTLLSCLPHSLASHSSATLQVGLEVILRAGTGRHMATRLLVCVGV